MESSSDGIERKSSKKLVPPTIHDMVKTVNRSIAPIQSTMDMARKMAEPSQTASLARQMVGIDKISRLANQYENITRVMVGVDKIGRLSVGWQKSFSSLDYINSIFKNNINPLEPLKFEVLDMTKYSKIFETPSQLDLKNISSEFVNINSLMKKWFHEIDWNSVETNADAISLFDSEVISAFESTIADAELGEEEQLQIDGDLEQVREWFNKFVELISSVPSAVGDAKKKLSEFETAVAKSFKGHPLTKGFLLIVISFYIGFYLANLHAAKQAKAVVPKVEVKSKPIRKKKIVYDKPTDLVKIQNKKKAAK